MSMTDSLRKQVIDAVQTVVVKVGTRVVTRPDATLNVERISRLAEELSAIMASGRRVVLVSSGAVGAGVGLMQLGKRPTDVARLQAVAAIGQTHLIQYYDHIFQQHGRRAAQVLLTGDDLTHRQRYLNVRNALLSILEFGAVPIINENDTVAVDELMVTFGDNDRLAAMVTTCLRAELLVILSDVPGLYDGDPARPEAQLIPTVPKIDATILSYVRDKLTGLSKGGMASKLNAARMVTTSGEHCLIASGRQDDVLSRIFAAEPTGTLFLPHGRSISPFKRWLGFSAQARGRIVIDSGARRALAEQGKSLLAIGVAHCEGKFRKGDVVDIYDDQGQLVARGLTNYDLDDIARIKGLRSDKIAQVLGTEVYDEVIHRDNLTIVG
jgi:glutamate 5-kinase